MNEYIPFFSGFFAGSASVLITQKLTYRLFAWIDRRFPDDRGGKS